MNKLFKRGMLLFTNDLRRTDNRVLEQAIRSCEMLLLVYIHDEKQLIVNELGLKPLGARRQKFLFQTLLDLKKELAGIHLHLHLLQGDSLELLLKLIETSQIEALFVNRAVDPNRRQLLCDLNFRIQSSQYKSEPFETNLSRLKVFECMNFNLFDTGQFNSDLSKISNDLVEFVEQTSQLTVRPPFYNNYKNVPASVILGFEFERFQLHLDIRDLQNLPHNNDLGGSTFGLKQLGRCLANLCEERITFGSKIHGIDNDDLLMTPWISNGSVSMRTYWYTLLEFEDTFGQAGFIKRFLSSILKIEHYHWLAIKHGESYFDAPTFHISSLSSDALERFDAWRQARTSSALVNACMNQLNQTGYITIVARRILAFYLIHVLKVSWQLGAAYFQMQFIDYDPAVVWGGWREMAGISPNLSPDRDVLCFDLETLAQLRDPKGEYVARWKGLEGTRLQPELV